MKQNDGDQLQQVWTSVEKFFDNAKTGINICNTQPGTGKTTAFIEYCKRNAQRKDENKKLIGFFSSNHAHLDEVEKKLIKNNIKVDHWKGFPRFCPLYPKSNDISKMDVSEKFIYKLYNQLRISSKIICGACDNKENCYSLPQPTVDVVLSPLEFLFQIDIAEKFKVIFIDEALLKDYYYCWDYSEEKIEKFMVALKDNCHISDTRYNFIKELFKQIYIVHMNLLKNSSLVFTRPEESIDFNSKNIKIKDELENVIKRDGNKIIHYNKFEKIMLSENSAILEKLKEMAKPARVIMTQLIQNAIEQKNDKFFDSYISFDDFIEFLDKIRYYGTKAAVFSEEINIKYEKDLTVNQIDVAKEKIIEENEKFIFGFIDERPYLKHKDTNYYVISNMGEEYDSWLNKNDWRKEAWIEFGIPYTIRVMEIAEDIPTVLLDAAFSKEIFEGYVSRYMLTKSLKYPDEPNKRKAPNVYYIEEIIIKNKKSRVYKVLLPHHGMNWSYPKSTLSHRNNKIFKEIYDQIKDLMSVCNIKTIGTISRLDYEHTLAELSGKKYALHFSGQRGTNILEEVEILFIIGTPYLPPGVVPFKYITSFGAIPDDIKPVRYPDGFFRYADPLMDALQTALVYGEVYQAIHRCRPLLNNKRVACYCYVPMNVREELTYSEVKFLDLMGDMAEPPKLREFLMDKLINNLNETLKIIKRKHTEMNKHGSSIAISTLRNEYYYLTEKDTETVILEICEPVMNRIINKTKQVPTKNIDKTKLMKGIEEYLEKNYKIVKNKYKLFFDLSLKILIEKNIVAEKKKGRKKIIYLK